MTERADFQTGRPHSAGRVGEGARTTEKPPLIISKKWLAVRFEMCAAGSGEINYRRLYRLVLTPEVLAHIGKTLPEVRCRSVKEFDAITSRKLIEILQL